MMNRNQLLVFLMALCVVMLGRIGTAQYQTQNPNSQPYQPAVPPPSMTTAYGAYPGYAGASTAAGSKLNGMANVVSAKGNYNLSTSAAAVNMTQAQSKEIQNHQQYENTYFQMKQTNQAYQKAHAGPRPTEQQLVRLAREGLPKPVSSSQVNPVNGKIKWPAVLQMPCFAENRATLEKYSAKMAANGSLNIADQIDARKTIESMFKELKQQINNVPTYDYLASHKFLRSMIYALAHSDLQ
ncbi:MAG: hypothetical protein JXM70_18245 [Pirellulales bacterium]|nr:hypothetical protein [Pirellulales bacterium]